MEDVTTTIISNTRHAVVPSHLRLLAPAPKITPTGRKVLKLVHDMRIGFVSNPLVYEDSFRHWPKVQHKTLLRLLLGGFLQVYRVNGPLPGNHPRSRIGAHSISHYLLRAPSLTETSES
jgi:hypothetical protein